MRTFVDLWLWPLNPPLVFVICRHCLLVLLNQLFEGNSLIAFPRSHTSTLQLSSALVVASLQHNQVLGSHLTSIQFRGECWALYKIYLQTKCISEIVVRIPNSHKCSRSTKCDITWFWIWHISTEITSSWLDTRVSPSLRVPCILTTSGSFFTYSLFQYSPDSSDGANSPPESQQVNQKARQLISRCPSLDIY